MLTQQISLAIIVLALGIYIFLSAYLGFVRKEIKLRPWIPWKRTVTGNTAVLYGIINILIGSFCLLLTLKVLSNL